MIRAAAILAAIACLLPASCRSLRAEAPMPPETIKPALYRIVSTRPDGACLWATMVAVRTGGDPVRSLFCNPEDVAYLRDGSPRHRMATLLEKNGAAARLLPVTVGLDVSVMPGPAGGDAMILALPRPAPLRLPAALGTVRATIARAAEARQPVAFALSDARTIIDAAPIDRAEAREMLGMQETPPR